MDKGIKIVLKVATLCKMTQFLVQVWLNDFMMLKSWFYTFVMVKTSA